MIFSHTDRSHLLRLSYWKSPWITVRRLWPKWVQARAHAVMLLQRAVKCVWKPQTWNVICQLFISINRWYCDIFSRFAYPIYYHCCKLKKKSPGWQTTKGEISMAKRFPSQHHHSSGWKPIASPKTLWISSVGARGNSIWPKWVLRERLRHTRGDTTPQTSVIWNGV